MSHESIPTSQTVTSSESTGKFPLDVGPAGRGDVVVTGPDINFRLCAHGARELAARLLAVADQQYCDGYRHGDESTMFVGGPAIVYTTKRVKPLAELRASDVPMGMDPDDLATDLAPHS